MGIQVTLDVPENIYHEVEQIAQATQRDVNELLTEVVIRSFPPFYTDPDQDKMQREVDAFEAMHATLWEKYPNQYVAVYQGQVIDHDADEMRLIGRIRAIYPDEIIMVDQVLPQLQRELVFRSPRFAFGL
ncbi:MAG: DUF5678 domain-containing protein [Chloroflexi bacterium]|nr:DUF5678 domain-containing protein [Chloroflexota bacterium]